MSVNVDPELARFNRFVSEKIGAGGGDISPEEALDLWRAENPAAEERAEAVRALKEALEELRAGDAGVSLEDFDTAFRERNGLGRSSCSA
ncbi:MAG TPA: hypothetical protein VEI07_10710 [Planctomycetaceae bacterium]|nr:hypothetical protein [Planctomycetaceae bacterium]